jgi:hypothetical protein
MSRHHPTASSLNSDGISRTDLGVGRGRRGSDAFDTWGTAT